MLRHSSDPTGSRAQRALRQSGPTPFILSPVHAGHRPRLCSATLATLRGPSEPGDRTFRAPEQPLVLPWLLAETTARAASQVPAFQLVSGDPQPPTELALWSKLLRGLEEQALALRQGRPLSLPARLQELTHTAVSEGPPTPVSAPARHGPAVLAVLQSRTGPPSLRLLPDEFRDNSHFPNTAVTPTPPPSAQTHTILPPGKAM